MIIIGGGFSGLVLANLLVENNRTNFLLLERNDRVGKKILVTGNGRCNLTNDDLRLSHYHSKNPSFFEYAIKKYDNGVIEGFFNRRGLLLTRENGRVYPLSRVANAVLDALRYPVADHVVTGALVGQVKKEGRFFTVEDANGNAYRAEKVVLAFGGRSGQNLGTDGRGYRLAESLGHSVTATYPSLVQMKSKCFGKGLKGIKHYAKVALYDDKRYICQNAGDFLITDTGVSGNTVFELSSQLGGLNKPILKVDFVPEYDEQVIRAALGNKRRAFGFLSAREILTGYVHAKLSSFIAEKTSVADKKIYELSQSKVDEIVSLVKKFPVPIDGTAGFDMSQVTRGGIDTKDVDPVTMESKIVKGVYIIGEALDVDGDCGGYNLQWAFSSASAVAESVI
mgnify:CR=1 FL=1